MTNDKQRLFDATVCLLAGQGRRSVGGTEQLCMYRGPDDARCAIGFWIPDAEYKPEMEGRGILQFTERETTQELDGHGMPVTTRHPGVLGLDDGSIFFLRKMQRIHDDPNCFSRQGYARLLQLASEYGLNADIVQAVWRWKDKEPIFS